jgi:hypothetical protein
MKLIKLIGVLSPFLLVSLTSCAQKPVVRSEAVPCQHPIINPVNNAGLVEAVAEYHTAIEECNKVNGK